MAAAIWSCPTSVMLDYPFASFVRFLRNHGLLKVVDRPQWYTVAGGAREYVNRLAGTCTSHILPRVHSSFWRGKHRIGSSISCHSRRYTAIARKFAALNGN